MSNFGKIPKGKLMPVGGHVYIKGEQRSHKQRHNPDFPGDEILKTFFAESSSEDGVSRIGILPTASGDAKESAEHYRKAFDALGNNELTTLDIKTKKKANDPKILEKVRKLYGIFITGGDQSLINKAILNTDLHDLLKSKYEEEHFIIAGTSAGAMCLARDMIVSGEADEGLIKGEVKFMDGLGFIDKLVIGTHFHERGRWGRLLQAVMLNSDCTGIGLAEDTAILIEKGNQIKVFGSGEVAIFDIGYETRSDMKKKRKGEPISVRNVLLHTYSRLQHCELKNTLSFRD